MIYLSYISNVYAEGSKYVLNGESPSGQQEHAKYKGSIDVDLKGDINAWRHFSGCNGLGYKHFYRVITYPNDASKINKVPQFLDKRQKRDLKRLRNSIIRTYSDRNVIGLQVEEIKCSDTIGDVNKEYKRDFSPLRSSLVKIEDADGPLLPIQTSAWNEWTPCNSHGYMNRSKTNIHKVGYVPDYEDNHSILGEIRRQDYEIVVDQHGKPMAERGILRVEFECRKCDFAGDGGSDFQTQITTPEIGVSSLSGDQTHDLEANNRIIDVASEPSKRSVSDVGHTSEAVQGQTNTIDQALLPIRMEPWSMWSRCDSYGMRARRRWVVHKKGYEPDYRRINGRVSIQIRREFTAIDAASRPNRNGNESIRKVWDSEQCRKEDSTDEDKITTGNGKTGSAGETYQNPLYKRDSDVSIDDATGPLQPYVRLPWTPWSQCMPNGIRYRRRINFHNDGYIPNYTSEYHIATLKGIRTGHDKISEELTTNNLYGAQRIKYDYEECIAAKGVETNSKEIIEIEDARGSYLPVKSGLWSAWTMCYDYGLRFRHRINVHSIKNVCVYYRNHALVADDVRTIAEIMDQEKLLRMSKDGAAKIQYDDEICKPSQLKATVDSGTTKTTTKKGVTISYTRPGYETLRNKHRELDESKAKNSEANEVVISASHQSEIIPHIPFKEEPIDHIKSQDGNLSEAETKAEIQIAEPDVAKSHSLDTVTDISSVERISSPEVEANVRVEEESGVALEAQKKADKEEKERKEAALEAQKKADKEEKERKEAALEAQKKADKEEKERKEAALEAQKKADKEEKERKEAALEAQKKADKEEKERKEAALEAQKKADKEDDATIRPPVLLIPREEQEQEESQIQIAEPDVAKSHSLDTVTDISSVERISSPEVEANVRVEEQSKEAEVKPQEEKIKTTEEARILAKGDMEFMKLAEESRKAEEDRQVAIQKEKDKMLTEFKKAKEKKTKESMDTTEEASQQIPVEESEAKDTTEEASQQIPVEESEAKDTTEEASQQIPVEESEAKDTTEEASQQIPVEESEAKDTTEEASQQIPVEESEAKDTTEEASQQIPVEESEAKDTTEEASQQIPVEESESKDTIDEASQQIPVEESEAKDTTEEASQQIPEGESESKDTTEEASQQIPEGESESKDTTEEASQQIPVEESEAKDTTEEASQQIPEGESESMDTTEEASQQIPEGEEEEEEQDEEASQQIPVEESEAKDTTEEASQQIPVEESEAKDTTEEASQQIPVEESEAKDTTEEASQQIPVEESEAKDTTEEASQQIPVEESEAKDTTEEASQQIPVEESEAKDTIEEASQQIPVEESEAKDTTEEASQQIPEGESESMDTTEEASQQIPEGEEEEEEQDEEASQQIPEGESESKDTTEEASQQIPEGEEEEEEQDEEASQQIPVEESEAKDTTEEASQQIPEGESESKDTTEEASQQIPVEEEEEEEQDEEASQQIPVEESEAKDTTEEASQQIPEGESESKDTTEEASQQIPVEEEEEEEQDEEASQQIPEGESESKDTTEEASQQIPEGEEEEEEQDEEDGNLPASHSDSVISPVISLDGEMEGQVEPLPHLLIPLEKQIHSQTTMDAPVRLHGTDKSGLLGTESALPDRETGVLRGVTLDAGQQDKQATISGAGIEQLENFVHKLKQGDAKETNGESVISSKFQSAVFPHVQPVHLIKDPEPDADKEILGIPHGIEESGSAKEHDKLAEHLVKSPTVEIGTHDDGKTYKNEEADDTDKGSESYSSSTAKVAGGVFGVLAALAAGALAYRKYMKKDELETGSDEVGFDATEPSNYQEIETAVRFTEEDWDRTIGEDWPNIAILLSSIFQNHALDNNENYKRHSKIDLKGITIQVQSIHVYYSFW
ncbi:hypothetical protein BdWA1_000751 [Babesia duncani]|uniref:Uncharacterized protein n=1 Tax=Babesia duncani TaxID=323732 RepID=A0AAD9PMY5_9APIC|nr:hypothetical protein BdWA1_000751 [Babesia duncani]